MKKLIVPSLVVIALILTMIGGGLAYKYISYKGMLDNLIYPENTTITIKGWTLDAAGLNAEEAYDKYINSREDIIFTVTLKNDKYKLDLTDCYSRTIKMEDFESLFNNVTFEGYLLKDTYRFNLDDTLICDNASVGEIFKDFIENVEYEYFESKDAYFDKETYTVVKAINGTQIDNDKAYNAFMNALLDDKDSLNLNGGDLFILANVQTAEVEEEYKELLSIANWSVTYPIADYTISMRDYMDYVTENNDKTYSIDTSFLKWAVLGLSKIVDEAGGARVFNSTLNGEIVVTGGTYGQMMNNLEEIEYLKGALERRESIENREPIWKISPDLLGNEDTYVEVDLTAQHVWFYKDGELIMDTNCVTGTKNTSRETPTGSYYISEKVNGKYLIGPTWKSWVDKWMRLTTDGVGLHDAQWRALSEFNPNRYTFDGSHGCINLPKAFAYDLYDEVEVGTLVIIHD